MGPDAATAALLDEAMKKSGLVWLGTGGSTQPRAFWHAWLDGKAYLLTGADEQPDPDLRERGEVEVLVRSKDTAHRMLVFRATVTLLLATDADWEAATAQLAKSRLNLSDAAGAPTRWAYDRGYRLYRLTPTGTLVEGPAGADTPYPAQSLRAQPVPTPATTTGKRLWVLHRRDTRRRPLS